MERHAVPQNIMEVEFKLLGAITLKQFGYLAAGFIAAAIMWFTGLPFLIRFPLMLFSAIMGVFLALVKINGQPSSTFVTNYILAMFTSQTRVWRKAARTPDVLQDDRKMGQDINEQLVKKVQKSASTHYSNIPLANLAQQVKTEADNEENQRLTQIDQHFQFAINEVNSGVKKVERDVDLPGVKQSESKVQANQPAPVGVPNQNLAGNIGSSFTQSKAEPVINTGNFVSMVNPVNTDAPVANSSTQNEQQPNVNKPTAAPNPTITQKPNIISGVVTDKSGGIIANAVVSIKDKKGILLRRAYSDSQGRFALINPLEKGEYHIDIDAEGFKFNTYMVILKDEVEPIFKFKAN